MSVNNENIDNIIVTMEEDVVDLSEIVITSKNIEMFADHSTYRLSEKDISSFSDALTALNVIPKLQIHDLSLSTMDGKTVKILINGINADAADLSVINSNDILRIEYHENAPIRFASAGLGAVVNIITKKSNYGGTIGVNLKNSPFTAYGNDVVSFKYNFKNSQIGIKYNINYRNLKERLLDEKIEYQFEDINYKKEKNGISGFYKYTEQLLEINFTNSKADNYTFNSKFSLRDNSKKRNSKQSVIQYQPSYIEKIGLSSDYDKNINPSLDLYFSKIFNSKHELLFNLVGTHFNTKYNYDYSETYDTQVDFETATNIAGEKYSLIGDALYSYKANKNKFTIGVRYLHRNSKQEINKISNIGSINDELVAYGEMAGKIDKFSYVLSLGLNHSQFSSNTINKSYKFISFKPIFNMNEDYIFETLDNITNVQNIKWSAYFQWFPFPSKILRVIMYGELTHSSNIFENTKWVYNGYLINPIIIVNYKKWNLIMEYLSNSKILSGQRLTESPSVTNIELSYKPIKNMTIGVAIRYPFYKAWEKSSETHPSALVNIHETEKVKDMANIIYLRLVYNFSFGEKGSDIKQKLENKDKDSGVFVRP